MAGYDQKVKIRSKYKGEAKDFFKFLQAIGRKYPRPVRIKYRDLGRGYFYVVVDGGSGGIDALYQELILDKGLYYYGCSIKNKRQEIIAYVIAPLFEQLLDARFQNPYGRFLKRHILGKISQDRFMPGDFQNPFSHEYEILFRKWDRQMIDDWNFIKDLDSLATRFLLTQMGHIPGQRSPEFSKLIKKAQDKGIGMMDEVRGKFGDVHRERTNGLHRLKVNLTKEQISELAFWIHNYFQFFDEFTASQKVKTEKLHGKRYRRVKYGDEVWEAADPEPEWWKEIAKTPCHDCAAVGGQYHCEGCDVEQCPRCRNQMISCDCKLKKDF